MNQQLEQLETEGYAVFPNFLDAATSARIREHMDSLLPPVAAPDDESTPRLHAMRHPISGAIMAEIITPELSELASQLLQSSDLRLLEQVLVRTDPAPLAQRKPQSAQGWHVDMAFHPSHYESTPRHTYFHMMHCLNTVAPGGGAFTIVPGSHHQTYAAAKELGEAELSQLKQNPIERAGIDDSRAVEVLAREGDLLVFNPMALHSGSVNISEKSRYVYFASFFDSSATYLQDYLRTTDYARSFPASLRENLPAELLYLLND